MRCWTKMIGLLAAVVFLGASMTAQAALLFEESFDYTAGSALTGQGVWVSIPSGPQTNGTVSSSGLTYPGLLTTGNAVDHPAAGGQHGLLPTAADAVFTTGGDYYVTYLIKSSTENNQAIFRSPVPGGFFISAKRFGPTGQLETSTGTPTSGAGGVMSDTEVNLVALRFRNDGSTGLEEIKMVLNPDLSLGEPDWSSAYVTHTKTDLTGAAVNTFVLDLASDAAVWDEIRIATTWDEAAPVPEPVSLILLGLGGLMMMMMRRQR